MILDIVRSYKSFFFFQINLNLFILKPDVLIIHFLNNLKKIDFCPFFIKFKKHIGLYISLSEVYNYANLKLKSNMIYYYVL